jgi:hypothetical protein
MHRWKNLINSLMSSGVCFLSVTCYSLFLWYYISFFSCRQHFYRSLSLKNSDLRLIYWRRGVHTLERYTELFVEFSIATGRCLFLWQLTALFELFPSTPWSDMANEYAGIFVWSAWTNFECCKFRTVISLCRSLISCQTRVMSSSEQNCLPPEDFYWLEKWQVKTIKVMRCRVVTGHNLS